MKFLERLKDTETINTDAIPRVFYEFTERRAMVFGHSYKIPKKPAKEYYTRGYQTGTFQLRGGLKDWYDRTTVMIKNKNVTWQKSNTTFDGNMNTDRWIEHVRILIKDLPTPVYRRLRLLTPVQHEFSMSLYEDGGRAYTLFVCNNIDFGPNLAVRSPDDVIPYVGGIDQNITRLDPESVDRHGRWASTEYEYIGRECL